MSKVRVAFFESHYSDGSTVELTEGSLYYHVAIEIGGKWYHTSPKDGVTHLKGLHAHSDIKLVEVLEHNELKVMYRDLKPYLDQKFDFTYTWENTESTYCSKFIAQLLGVKPTPVKYSSKHWKLAKGVRKNGLGISPDELFEGLLDKGFEVLPIRGSRRRKEVPRCRSLFKM